jgi:nanoRNase/pAp phosphatase (c-di-AMP/oligoRNAs hydrolase)
MAERQPIDERLPPVAVQSFGPRPETVVISHAGCPDGVTAAWILKKFYSDAIVHFTRERDFSKDDKMPSLEGRVVFIVDYSYPQEVVKKIEETAKLVLIWDHHKTALEDLVSVQTLPADGFALANTEKHRITIDLHRCGAEIVWDEMCIDVPKNLSFDPRQYVNKFTPTKVMETYNLSKNAIMAAQATMMFAGLTFTSIPNGMYDERPWFLKHVRDRDLWLWEDPNSKAFSQAFFDAGLTFETLDRFAQADPDQIREIYRLGEESLTKQQIIIDKAVARSELCQFFVPVDPENPYREGYTVAVVNQTQMQSEVGNALCEKTKTVHGVTVFVDFAVIIRNGDDRRTILSLLTDPDADVYISLRGARTRSDGTTSPDLSRIAKFFDGGGHPNAAGFTSKLSKLSSFLKVCQ